MFVGEWWVVVVLCEVDEICWVIVGVDDYLFDFFERNWKSWLLGCG